MPTCTAKSSWQEENTFKHSNVTFINNKHSNAVLLAAIDWQNFQSLENSQALYIAVLNMLGKPVEVPFQLD